MTNILVLEKGDRFTSSRKGLPEMPNRFLVIACKGARTSLMDWSNQSYAERSCKRLESRGFITRILPPGSWGRR